MSILHSTQLYRNILLEKCTTTKLDTAVPVHTATFNGKRKVVILWLLLTEDPKTSVLIVCGMFISGYSHIALILDQRQ